MQILPVIISFEEQYAADFKQLNLAWLEKYHLAEPADLAMLDNPKMEILDKNGSIFLAKMDGKIVGSAALIPRGNGIVELAKMAVAEKFQGRGISNLLINRCLEQAKKLAAKRIYLLSNSQLTTALMLYKKFGFREIPVTGSYYETADVMMELVL